MLSKFVTLPDNKAVVRNGQAQSLRVAISVALFAIVVYGNNNFIVAWDLTDYLAVPKNLAPGQGFYDSTGTPAYDRMCSPLNSRRQSKSLVHRLSAVTCATYATSALLVAEIFFLGEELYGRAVGKISRLFEGGTMTMIGLTLVNFQQFASLSHDVIPSIWSWPPARRLWP